MPSDAAVAAAGGTGLSRSSGGAIWMERLDHLKTLSNGPGDKAVRYREIQRKLIASGRFLDAAKMDVKLIQKQFPGKYDEAIQMYGEYLWMVGQ